MEGADESTELWRHPEIDLYTEDTKMNQFIHQTVNNKGSGCGSVSRAVASDTRGLWFKSSHWQNVY